MRQLILRATLKMLSLDALRAQMRLAAGLRPDPLGGQRSPRPPSLNPERGRTCKWKGGKGRRRERVSEESGDGGEKREGSGLSALY